MEINFTELSNNQEPKILTYWSQPTNTEIESKNIKTKKKKVSFDDILSNMNLVVNQNGTLQHMSSNKETIEIQNSNSFQNSNNQGQNQIHVQKYETIDPNIKHSYIYNKYFKDYNNMNNIEPEIRVPKTIEEYKKMLLEDRIKVMEQKKRISQIKSKKLLFTTNVSFQSGTQVSSNSLKNMKFF